MKRFIPVWLTTLRLLLGPLAVGCAYWRVSHWVFAPILLGGTLSDIFDGVLARRFGVSTPALRRYDSIADLIYYLFIVAAAWIMRRSLIVDHISSIVVLISAELVVIALSLIRFGVLPATHSCLAKFYGLCLLAGLMALLAFDAHNWALVALVCVSVAANLEILMILLLSKTAPVDVRSVLHIRQRR